MSSSRFHPASALIGFALLASACGGDSPPDPPSNGGSGGAVQIRGGERLAWIQAAPSESAVRAYQFTLYVDGIEAVMSDVRCASPAANGYDCSGRLPSMSPGRHVLELASSWSGQQSPRSSALTVMVLAAQQTSALPLSSTHPGLRGNAAAECAVRHNAQCHDVVVVANGLRGVSAPTATADGRLLFVESETRVRVVEGATLLPEPLYVPDAEGHRLVGLAADPVRERGHFVYVAWSEPMIGGSPIVHVTRFRELAGALGQGATIVTELPFRPGAAAPLLLDDEGMLYVALPKTMSAAHGLVLRFSSDGRTPDSNPRASPVLARGLALPSGLRLDRKTRRIWIAGSDEGGHVTKGSFAIDSTSGASWPQELEVPSGSNDAFGDAAFAGLSGVEGFASGADNALYVMVRDAGNTTTSILLLTPR